MAKELTGYILQFCGLRPPEKGFIGFLKLGSGYDHRLVVEASTPSRARQTFQAFVRLGDVHKAMLVLENWIQKEHGNEFDVRCDWREGTGASWTVDNTDGKKIHKGFPERIQTKMWRDMALKAVATKIRTLYTRL